MAVVQAAIIGSTASDGFPIPGSGTYNAAYGGNSSSGTPYDPGRGQSSVANSTAGFYRRAVLGNWYTGDYTTTDMTFFDGAPVLSQGKDTFVSFGAQLDVRTNYSMYFLGYFQAPATGDYNIAINSDDESMVWIGTNAVSGFTGSNCLITSGISTEDTNSLYLVENKWYPIRIWYREGGGNDLCQLFIGQAGDIMYNIKHWSNQNRIAYDSVTKGLNITARVDATSYNNWEGLVLQNNPTNNTTYLTFDGSNQYATATPGLNSSGGFSLELWARIPTDNGVLIGDGISGYHASLVEIIAGDIVAGYWTGTGEQSGTVLPSMDRLFWHHYVYVYDPSGPQLRFYVDGVSVMDLNLAAKVDSGAVLELFKSESTNIGDGTSLAGDLGEFRLWDLVLSQSKITSQYNNTKSLYLPTFLLTTSGFSVASVNEGTALTFHVSTNNVLDGTALIYNITSTGSYPITRDRLGLPGSARFINAYPTGQYLSATVTAPGTDSTTYEWWFYNTSDAIATQGMLQTRTNTADGDGIDVSINSGSIIISNSGGFLLSGAGTVALNTWYHIALVRVGTTNWTVYLNGTSIGTFTFSNSTGTELSIGRKSASGYNEFFDGYITNFRYVKGTAVYTANFVPSPSPLAAISGTELLLLTNSNVELLTDSSGLTVVVTNNNSVVWDSLSPLNPSFVVTSNTASFDITTSADVFTATGTQSYTVTLSTDGNDTVGNTVYITVNDTSLTRPQWHNGDATASGLSVSYRYYKFHITKVRSEPPANNATQIGELIILNGNTRITGGTATNPGGTQAFVYQGADKILEGYYDDKWCDTAYVSNGNSSVLTIDYTTAQTSNGFTYATGDDNSNRDPVQWTFEGSNDGSTWTVIHEQYTDATITTDRNALVSTVFSYPTHGSAVIDQPVNDYLSVPAGSYLNLGTTWTVEFSVYMNYSSIGPTHQQGGIWGVLNQGGWATTDSINIALSGGLMQINMGGNSAYNNMAVSEPVPQQWVHVAVVNNAGTVKVYYNGIEQVALAGANMPNGSGTASWTNSTDPLYIGSLNAGNSFDGRLTNLRITDTAEYLTNFYPPTTLPAKIAGHTRLRWTPIDGALNTDTSDVPHTITNSGASYSSSYPVPNNTRGSAVFAGPGGSSFIQVGKAGNTPWVLGMTWTIEWWSNATAATTNNINSVLVQQPGGSSIDIYYQNGHLYAGNAQQRVAAEPTAAVWTHVAIVNTAGSMAIYYNGIAQSLVDSSNYNLTDSSRALYIGTRGSNFYSQFFDGKLTNIRITDTAVYSGSFNPDVLPAVIADHTKLLYTPTVDTMYGVAAGNIAIGTRNISYSTDYPVVVLPQSYSFGNNSPFMGMAPGYTFGTGAFTLQGWTKFTSSVSGGLTSSNGSVGAMACGFVDANNFFVYKPGVGATATFTISPSLTTGNWHHFALVRDGSGYLALFVDGTRTGYDASHTFDYNGVTEYLFNGVGAVGFWDTAKLADFEIANTNLFDPTQSTITVPFPNLYATAGVTKLLMDGKVSKTTDAAGTQTITQLNGTITLSSDFPV